MALALPVHEALASARRLAPVTPRLDIAAWEVGALLVIGAVAATASTRVELHLGIPGHSIVLSVFPMALGVALIPRRFAGTVMGTSALVTTLALRAGGLGERGPGALVSLVATGLLLDLALRRARGGILLCAAFVLAGIGANTVALDVRIGTELAGIGGMAPFSPWLTKALVSYPICGAMAGLVSAAAWFHLSPRPR